MGFSRQEHWSVSAISSSSGSSWPREGTRVSCVAGGFFITKPSVVPGGGVSLPHLDCGLAASIMGEDTFVSLGATPFVVLLLCGPRR